MPRKSKRKGKFLKKTRTSLKRNLKKIPGVGAVGKKTRGLKPYAKAGFALTATGLAYATTYTVAKGIGETVAPEQTYKVNSFLTNTDLGLVAQTGLIVGSTGLAIKFLDSGFGKTVVPNFFSRFKDEKKIMLAGSTSFATYRLLTGLSYKNTGKRFQALFDADLPGAVFTDQGPYFNRPSNIRAMNEVIRGDLSNQGNFDKIKLTDRFFNLFSPKYGGWVAGRDSKNWSNTHQVTIPNGQPSSVSNFDYRGFKTVRPPFPPNNNQTPTTTTQSNQNSVGDGLPNGNQTIINNLSNQVMQNNNLNQMIIP